MSDPQSCSLSQIHNSGDFASRYALVAPETEAAKHAILGNALNGPEAARRHHLERHMFDFQIRALQGDRAGAIKMHAEWIEAQAAEDGDDHIPWRQEAALFANIYWSNRRRYEAEFASAKAAE